MNWTCPYCSRTQTVTSARFSSGEFHFHIGKTAIGHIGLRGNAICCANEECLKVTVVARVQPAGRYERGSPFFEEEAKPIVVVTMMPESSAKPQPDFIPAPLREDYVEACRIRDLSPKASATLSRRCLQGMIRDFCDVRERTLFDEITVLKDLIQSGNSPAGVSLESVEAIDHVRGVGNIGAHMERDINQIVPVDPQEAQLLIELIESLFEEWYVAREKRTSRFAEIKALADSKKNLISALKAPQLEGPKAVQEEPLGAVPPTAKPQKT